MAEILTLIASDIFGRTAALQRLVDKLLGYTTILDPYEGEAVSFNDEKHAYTIFNQQVGADRYVQRLRDKIGETSGTFQLLGFSAGATACWRVAGEDKHPELHQALCIYGSQIRHHCHLQPSAPTTVVLPAVEASFDINEHAEILDQIPQVTLKQTPYMHGYMNELSLNFDNDGYNETLRWLNTVLPPTE